MMPKTEKEIDLYIKLQFIVEAKKMIEKGSWHFGSVSSYNYSVSCYEKMKEEYLKLANEM